MKHILSTVFLLVLVFSACSKGSSPLGANDRPLTLKITDVKLLRINESTLQGESWDSDGGAPDVFLSIVFNNRDRIDWTDTIADFRNGDNGDFTVLQKLVIERTDSIVAIEVFDEDFNPGLPPAFQIDDIISRFDSRPWDRPNALWEREVLQLTNRGATIELTIERIF